MKNLLLSSVVVRLDKPFRGAGLVHWAAPGHGRRLCGYGPEVGPLGWGDPAGLGKTGAGAFPAPACSDQGCVQR